MPDLYILRFRANRLLELLQSGQGGADVARELADVLAAMEALASTVGLPEHKKPMAPRPDIAELFAAAGFKHNPAGIREALGGAAVVLVPATLREPPVVPPTPTRRKT